MNLLKSVFISSYLMFVTVVAAYAVWQLYQGQDIGAWLGVALTTGPISMMIGRLMLLQDMPRTSANFPMLTLLGIIGSGLALWAWFSQSTDQLAPDLALAGLVLFAVYLFWYSRFDRSPNGQISVGKRLPDFTLTNVDGQSVGRQQLAEQPAILIFYRGNWCPLCMAQVKELAAQYQEIAALGIRVALISPQPHENTVKLSKKFAVDFDFLTDPENKAARALGIDCPNGLPLGMQVLGYDSDTVLPTVIITDSSGKVVWVHETDNYRVRPDPEVYLEVLRREGLAPSDTQ